MQRDSSCNTTLHRARLADEEWVCTVNPQVGGDLTDQHKVWFDDPLSSTVQSASASKLMTLRHSCNSLFSLIPNLEYDTDCAC